MLPTRETIRQTEIAHYVAAKAGVEFTKNARKAEILLRQDIQEVFGHDLDVSYVDDQGYLVSTDLEKKFTILVRDQYRVPLQ